MKTQVTHDDISNRSIENNFQLNSVELDNIVIYMNLLLKWNKVMNLIGPSDWMQTFDTLILDSLHLAKFIDKLQTESILKKDLVTWDFGAGAGLPGIPLRAVWQDGIYTMVEAREKRALFLRTVLAQSAIPATEVFMGRVEKFMPNVTPASLLVSRAFMPWEKLLHLMEGKLTSGGCILFLTLEPAPLISGALAESWSFECEHCYEIPNGESKALQHYFWLARYKK